MTLRQVRRCRHASHRHGTSATRASATTATAATTQPSSSRIVEAWRPSTVEACQTPTRRAGSGAGSLQWYLPPRRADAIAATAGVFDRHSALLRAVIHRAVDDPWLLQHGATTSRRLQERVGNALPTQDRELASSIARLVYSECAFRTMYGPQFWTDRGETLAAFTARITALVDRILAAPSP